MELQFADRMKEFEEGIFQVLNEKKNEKCRKTSYSAELSLSVRE